MLYTKLKPCCFYTLKESGPGQPDLYIPTYVIQRMYFENQPSSISRNDCAWIKCPSVPDKILKFFTTS